jgi:CRISPR-associated protein Cas1
LPAIDTMLEDESFAYRKGFSRQGAARAIQKAWDDGYRYVLDADIEAFFDAVEWDRLFAVLDALFPFEPLVRMIRHWITVPVHFDGRRIGRTRGLPQGAPISPLLANLFLDRFDEEILGEGFRLVRFADDFVVLTKDLASAERAHDVARRALGDLGLSLHEGKTSVRAMADGFGYLGYLFCRSLVVDEEKQEGGRPKEDVPPPATSWLAAVPFERLRRLGRPRIGAEGGPPPLEEVDLGPARAAFPAKRPLYLGDHETSMRVEKQTLVLEHPSRTRERLPLAGVLHLTILGHGRSTLTAIERLALHGVPTYLCDARGRLRASVGVPAPDWRVWQAQARLVADERRALAVARAIVTGKLRNQASQLARLGLGRGVTGPLRGLARDAEKADNADTLRGLEGRAARSYFAAFSEVLPKGFDLPGRRRRPPTDPVNSLLSFGYHLLFQHAATALVTAGLNPHLGIYHKPSDRYPSLASDLQEELRWLVDGLALSLLRRREARQEDFEKRPDGAVWMSRDLRKRYLEAFERRMLDTFTPKDGEAISYRGFLFEQAVALREIALGRLDTYRPLVRPA